MLDAVVAGRPPATLSWWRDGQRLEDVLVPGGDGSGDAASQLAVGPLGRRDLHASLVCRASNNNISEPLSVSVVIDIIRTLLESSDSALNFERSYARTFWDASQ